MLGPILFLLISWLFGYAALTALPLRFKLFDKAVWGLPIGLNMLGLIAFFAALATGSSNFALYFAPIFAALAVVGLSFVPSFRNTVLSEIPTLLKRRSVGTYVAWFFVVVPAVVYAFWMFPSLLYFKEGGLTAGWINVWGDWAAHLRNITFFAAQDKFSLENSLLAGTEFRYPVLSAYISSLFQRMGLDPVQAIVWTGLPILALLPAMIYSFFRKLGALRWAAVLGTALLMFAGGFGVFKLASDIFFGAPSNGVDAYHPVLYTDIRTPEGQMTNQGTWFMNFLICEFIPQRAYLVGFPWALMILLGIWRNFVRTPVSKHRYWAAIAFGLSLAFLPLFHTHSALALGLILIVLGAYLFVRALRTPGKPKLWWGPALVLLLTAAVPGFVVMKLFLINPTSVTGMMHFVLGWTPSPMDFLGWLAFTVKNLGVVFLVWIASFIWGSRTSRLFAISAVLLFALVNLVNLQPWIWDNMKILTWWYVVAAIACVFLAQNFVKKTSGIGRVGTGAFVALLAVIATGAGAADAMTMGLSTKTGGIGLTGPEGVQFAQAVRDYTEKTEADRNATILIAPTHDHPISLLTGRRIYMGYTGWVFSYGLDYQKTLDQIPTMYSGTPESKQIALKEKIGFIAFGPAEQSQFKADYQKLKALFEPVVTVGPYTLFRVQP